MRIEQWGGLRVRVTGGSDREGGGDGPAVVLLHGYGAPGDDLVPLWRMLEVPREVRFVFPEAPLSLPELGPLGARAWWRIDTQAMARAQLEGQPRDRSQDLPPELLEANRLVNSVLDDMERELGVTGDRILLGGFSQGAMVSCDVALCSERKLAGVVLLSGVLLAQPRWQAAAPAREGLPVLQSHGRQDPLLPFAAAEQLRELLRGAGLQVNWMEFNGGHELPAGVLSGLGEFIRAHT